LAAQHFVGGDSDVARFLSSLIARGALVVNLAVACTKNLHSFLDPALTPGPVPCPLDCA